MPAPMLESGLRPNPPRTVIGMPGKKPLSDEDLALFHREVGEVRPVSHDRVMPHRQPLSSRLREQFEDPTPVLFHGLSDELESEGLETHDRLWFARSGLQPQVLRKLRRGQFRLAAELDLHGMTVAMARPALADFLQYHLLAGHRCVRIIHGKGLGTRKQPVLKNKVNSWLQQVDDVLAFCSAQPADGGSGAVYVLLRKSRNPTNRPF